MTGCNSDTNNSEKTDSWGRLEFTFWLVAILFGAILAWYYRHTMNPDGISYIELGEACLRGGWQKAINGHWSPLYSWLIGLALRIVRPSGYWEFACVHLVNFILYIFSLSCFQFFMRELLVFRRGQSAKTPETKNTMMPPWALLVIGYSLFIWSSLYLISISVVTPDMCASALVYAAMGILLRIKRKPEKLFLGLLLGALLGLAYLARAAMILLSLVFLANILSLRNMRRTIPQAAVALLSFILVASPYIAALSSIKGRLTFGDSGKFAYAWVVNGIEFVGWHGQTPGSGIPKHPPRIIYSNPAVYEFSSPVAGTYPLWYDPSFWQEGLNVRFDLISHLKLLFIHLKVYYYSVLFPLGGLLAGFCVLFFAGWKKWLSIQNIAAYKSLLTVSLAALFLYTAVRVETRYIGVFVVLLWMGLLSGVRLPEAGDAKKLASGLVVAILVQMPLVAAFQLIPRALESVYELAKGEQSLAHPEWYIASVLRQKGIKPQEKVAVVGHGFNAYWAHLARVKIVVEIPDKEVPVFWKSNDTKKAEIITVLRRIGIRAIVARDVPCCVSSFGWEKIQDTDYYVLFL